MEPFVWDVAPEILKIGFLEIRWYGLFFATGLLLGYQIMWRFYQKANYSRELLDSCFLWFVLATVIGARLGHCLFYEPEYYLANPIEIIKVWKGGLASHGGTLGILVAMVLYTKKYQIPFLWLADRVAIPICFGIPWIRVGNFFNSEIVGRPASDVPWAVLFVRNSMEQVPRHPAQLYEAFGYVIIGILLTVYYKAVKGEFKPGRLIGMMLMMLFSVRFVVEFFKENQVGFENGLTLNMGQMLSIPMVLLGLILVLQKKTDKVAG